MLTTLGCRMICPPFRFRCFFRVCTDCRYTEVVANKRQFCKHLVLRDQGGAPGNATALGHSMCTNAASIKRAMFPRWRWRPLVRPKAAKEALQTKRNPIASTRSPISGQRRNAVDTCSTEPAGLQTSNLETSSHSIPRTSTCSNLPSQSSATRRVISAFSTSSQLRLRHPSWTT